MHECSLAIPIAAVALGRELWVTGCGELSEGAVLLLVAAGGPCPQRGVWVAIVTGVTAQELAGLWQRVFPEPSRCNTHARITVVVCTHEGAGTQIRGPLATLKRQTDKKQNKSHNINFNSRINHIHTTD